MSTFKWRVFVLISLNKNKFIWSLSYTLHVKNKFIAFLCCGIGTTKSICIISKTASRDLRTLRPVTVHIHSVVDLSSKRRSDHWSCQTQRETIHRVCSTVLLYWSRAIKILIYSVFACPLTINCVLNRLLFKYEHCYPRRLMATAPF